MVGVHNIYFSFKRGERLLFLSFSFLRLLPLSSPSTHGSLFSDALRGPPAVRELPGGGGALPRGAAARSLAAAAMCSLPY